MVTQPPLWDQAAPERYTYALYDHDLDEEQLLRFFQTARVLGLVNPRPISRSLLGSAAAYHPAFFRAMTRTASEQDDAERQLLHLRSRIFLAGCTLSAAIVQLRYSPATIRSKLRHLWIGMRHARAMGLEVDSAAIEDAIIDVATSGAHDVDRLIALKDLFQAALRTLFATHVAWDEKATDESLLTAGERERFGFVDELRELLGVGLRAILVYGSSASGDAFADYDVIAVVDDAHRGLRMLTGRDLHYRGKPLNLAIYDEEGFRLYQLACGDNLDANARCLFGGLKLLLKPRDALLERNFSFGYLRMRQLLGMAAHLAASDDRRVADRAELFEYFIKVPMHIYKGIVAVRGEPVGKDRLRGLLRERWGYDLDRQRDAIARGDAVAAMCRAYLATRAVLKDLGAGGRNIDLPSRFRPSGGALEILRTPATLAFDDLPLITEGESKIVRRHSPGVVAIRLKPTVYSFTHNRYGEVPGTERIRTFFAAEVFARMESAARAGRLDVQTAFLGLERTPQGPLLLQTAVEPCNLEVRVKRYHVGSPLHRYRFTERHASTLVSGPIVPWTRYPDPIVCFDWRHPLTDDAGERLTDEPISDDYAGLWMVDPGRAKVVAREAFLWLEAMFALRDLTLVDICFFIDRSGRVLYGEISPDCMRVRYGLDDPEHAQPGDKDAWRRGDGPETVYARYRGLYERVFSEGARITDEEISP